MGHRVENVAKTVGVGVLCAATLPALQGCGAESDSNRDAHFHARNPHPDYVIDNQTIIPVEAQNSSFNAVLLELRLLDGQLGDFLKDYRGDGAESQWYVSNRDTQISLVESISRLQDALMKQLAGNGMDSELNVPTMHTYHSIAELKSIIGEGQALTDRGYYRHGFGSDKLQIVHGARADIQSLGVLYSIAP